MLYNQLVLTDTTIKRRKQIKNLKDSFMGFQWRGHDAFDNFGMFIINEKKGNLKFYNGPGFSNEYSKPQFDSNSGSLMGVNFNRTTINFTVGVYWISVEHYRLLMNWLNPLVVDYIIFDFEPNYRYNVKLSKRTDSTRWIVGHEEGKPMYYTELALEFELQGAQCAKGVHSYEFIEWEINEESGFLKTKIKTETSEFIPSDLNTPINVCLDIPLKDHDKFDNATDIKDRLVLKAVYQYKDENEKEIYEEKDLFNIVLSNLTYSKEEWKKLQLNYNSETGLIFLNLGDNSYPKLLTSLNTTDTGERVVDYYETNKFFIPGIFEYPEFSFEHFFIKLEWERYAGENRESIYDLEGIIPVIECFPRTNLI